jgi:predicted dienelactone hydrolase
MAGVAGSRAAWAAKRRRADPTEKALLVGYIGTGPFPVKVANPLSFPMPAQKKNLLVRVTYPDPSTSSDGRNFPVILFSHGALSSKDLYTRVADHWASHGFVTIQPTHLDSESLGVKAGPTDSMALLASRIDDMKFLLDHLDDVAAQSPALSGRLAPDKIAVGGHSLGVVVALAMAGLQIKRPEGGTIDASDRRVRALMSYNGVGPMPFLADDWSTVKVPVFAASGTNDPGLTGDGVIRPWRWRMGAYDLTAGAQRYGASIAYGDHYYGGLICREGAGGKPDPEGLAIVDGLSTAFLDAVLWNNHPARLLLENADIAALTNDHAFLEATV